MRHLLIIILLLLLPVPAHAQGAIANDCSVDVTDALNGVLATIPDGSTLTLGPGCYRTDDEVRIVNRTGITLDGNGATLQRVTDSVADYCNSARCYSTTAHVQIEDSNHITVRNLNVLGTNTTPPDGYPEQGQYIGLFEFEHGIAIRSSEFVTVTGVTVDAVYGDGVYVGPSLSTDIVIRNVEVYRNGRVGIGPVHAERVLIDNAYIHNSRRSGIDMEPVSTRWYVRDVEIRNSYVNSRFAPIGAQAKGEVSGIYVHNNQFHGPFVPWLNARNQSIEDGIVFRNWRVEHNVVNRRGAPSWIPGMRFEGVENIIVRGNVAPLTEAREMVAVGLKDVSGVVIIEGNDFTGAVELVRFDTVMSLTATCNVPFQECD